MLWVAQQSHEAGTLRVHGAHSTCATSRVAGTALYAPSVFVQEAGQHLSESHAKSPATAYEAYSSRLTRCLLSCKHQTVTPAVAMCGATCLVSNLY